MSTPPLTHIILPKEDIIQGLESKKEEESCGCIVGIHLGYLQRQDTGQTNNCDYFRKALGTSEAAVIFAARQPATVLTSAGAAQPSSAERTVMAARAPRAPAKTYATTACQK